MKNLLKINYDIRKRRVVKLLMEEIESLNIRNEYIIYKYLLRNEYIKAKFYINKNSEEGLLIESVEGKKLFLEFIKRKYNYDKIIK